MLFSGVPEAISLIQAREASRPEPKAYLKAGASMPQLSTAGQAAIEERAKKYGFSAGAGQSMFWSVLAGNGTMAQFQHPEFGGSGQWMRGGMLMISDMFNHALKARIDGLCNELTALVAAQAELVVSTTTDFNQQHQSQGSRSGRSMAWGSSLFVPGTDNEWWGSELGRPSSVGVQNNTRYAWFREARRLAISIQGEVTIYDTLDHQIIGFSQQQSQGASLTFTSQHGVVLVSSLPLVSPGDSKPAQIPVSSQAESDIFASLEKLAELHRKGILSAEEFASKKADLLERL